jgi:hypothetical protein
MPFRRRQHQLVFSQGKERVIGNRIPGYEDAVQLIGLEIADERAETFYIELKSNLWIAFGKFPQDIRQPVVGDALYGTDADVSAVKAV